MRARFYLYFFLILLPLPAFAQDSYRIEKVSSGVYAALAEPGGAATSNAFIVDLGAQLIIGGAHFSRKAINDLIAATTGLNGKPIRAIVLAHHHPGYSFIDFDFPEQFDLAMNIETRLIMKQEARKLKNPVLFFKAGLTFEGRDRTLILTNVGPAHSNGDLLAYIPQDSTVFTSDLVYIDSVGFLGAGSLREWALALEGISALQIDKVIPGFGPIGDRQDLLAFKTYLKDFLTEIIRHIDRGDSLETTLETFSLPSYTSLPGYERFMPGNIERAYLQLKER